MKNCIFAAVLALEAFALHAQSVPSGGGSLAVYVELYNKSSTWQEKQVVLTDIRQAKIEGSIDFYAQAFSELIMVYRNLRTGSIEWLSANNIASALIVELVAGNRAASGDDFWRGYQVFTDSSLQAACIVALGELKVESHFSDVERVITTLNAKVNTTNRQNDENIAAGCFAALEKYGYPQGYLPAFVGSEGWYREYVKQAARQAMQTLLADPYQLYRDVIQSAYYSNALKIRALEYINASNLERSQKADAASRSLVLGWRSHSNDQRLQRELSEFRRLCLQMIRQNGSNGASTTYQAMMRSLQEGALDEKLESIPALGSLKTQEASTIIIDYALALNDNRRINNSQSIDDRLMRSLIPAIVETGDSKIKDVLYQVQSAPWSNTVLTMARDALAKIG